MNYKNKTTGEVISADCYNRLSYNRKQFYTLSYDEPTHRVSESYSNDDSDDLTDGLIGLALVSSMMPDSSSVSDFGSSDFSGGSSDFGGFGGGDTGGGGAGGDF